SVRRRRAERARRRAADSGGGAGGPGGPRPPARPRDVVLVIPAPFRYVRATSVDHALELLREHGDEAKLLAGGHSLLPLMKLRLAVPDVLVDVGRLDDLSYIREDSDEIVVGAMTRHQSLASS